MARIISLSGNRRYYTNSYNFFCKYKIYSSRSSLVRIIDNTFYFGKYFYAKYFLSGENDQVLVNLDMKSKVIKYALLDTSWYKMTSLIGFVQLYAGQLLFVKIFKTETAAIKEFENYSLVKRSKLASKFLIPDHWRCDNIIFSEAIIASGKPDFDYLLGIFREWDDDREYEQLSDKKKESITSALLHYNVQLHAVLSRFNSRTIETVFSHGDFKLDNIVKTSSDTVSCKNGYAILDFECAGMYPKHYDFFSLVMEGYRYDYERVSNLCESLFGSWENAKEHLENFLIFKLNIMIFEFQHSPTNKLLRKQLGLVRVFLDKMG